MSMITIRNLQFQYDAAPEINALYGIDLEIRKGECIVLTGESGCGKTTLTRCLNGLIPNFFEGTLTGEILYEGVPVNKMEQYELSRKIGTVFQDPRSQFFAVNTTDEVAFGCENLAFSTERINQNVDAAFSRMNIDVLRDRSLFGLSSGEKQRLAVASIYAMDTDVIVLDEPTANLDGETIQNLRELLFTLKAEGNTLIISEHRLSWLVGIADRYVYMRKGRIEKIWGAAEAACLSPDVLREYGLRSIQNVLFPTKKTPARSDANELTCQNLCIYYGKQEIIHDLNFHFTWGEEGRIIGIVGANGSGKTTFSKVLCGLMAPRTGEIRLNGKKMTHRELLKKTYFVIQYRDVFGKETVLKYTPLFSGLKEEIILQRPAENKIQFLLKTYEMEAVLTDNVISLFSDGTRCVGEISKITIYDSSAIPKVSTDSTVTLTATDKKGEYLYTISLDQNFLLREDIEYPVYVDPTVTISSSGYGTSKTILDTPVYSNVPSNCQGANIYNMVGNANALSNNYGVGRTLMKFPGLINHAIFQSISNSQVSSMKLHMYSSSGSVSQSSILVNHYTGSSWNETSTAYNNVSWNGYGLLISSTSIGSGNQWVSFELKNAIPTWQNNVSAADRGVMLRNSNETSTSASKTLCSTESSYKPYVSLTWFGSDPAGISSGNIYRLRNTFSSRYLSASSPTYFQQAISMNTTRGNDLWRFDRVSSGVYRIESLGVRCDSTGLQPSMLTASAGGSTSTSGTLSLTAYSSSNTRQWWYVTKNTQGYSLVSYYYPQLAITVSSATSAPTLSSNANHPKWTMTSASFSNYWSGSYSGGSSPYTINVIVESSAVTGYLTQSVYRASSAQNRCWWSGTRASSASETPI